MVNPNIIMSGQTPDTATPINDANDRMMNNALATEKLLKEHYETIDEREKSRLTSTIVGASQLKTYLDKDDAEGAHEFLLNRKKQLQGRMSSGENIDTAETDYAIDKLRRGDIDGLKNDVASIMAAGQVYGIVGGMSGAPSNVQEWQYYNSLSTEDQQRYLSMKRSNQVVNQGNAQTIVSPTGAPVTSYPVNLKPEDQPVNAAAKAKATAEGTAAGDNAANADNTINKMSGVLTAIDNLNASSINAPSGVIESGIASAANVTGVGGQAAQAQGDWSVKRAAAENEIRQAFRVVGSGAQTDRDALPFIEMLPEEGDADDVKAAKGIAAKQAVMAKVSDLARQRGKPDPFAGGAQGGKVQVSNGKETFMIDAADVAAAQSEGFQQVQ